MVIQMVKDVGEKGFIVDVVVGNEDFIIIGCLCVNVNEED